MRPGTLTAGLLLTCLACSPAAAAEGAGSFRLVYKPSTQLVEYRVSQVDRVSDQPDKAPVKWDLQQIAQITSQELRAAPDGSLLVDGEVLGESAFAPGHDADAPAPLDKPRPFKYGMSARGEVAQDLATEDATAVLAPVMPEGAVSPGFKWATRAPTAPGLKVPVTVNHEFLEVKVVDGMPCAIVVSEAQVKSPATGEVTVAFKGNAQTALSLTDGQLVHFEGFTALALRSTPAGAAGPQVLRRETLRTVVRQPASGGSQ